MIGDNHIAAVPSNQCFDVAVRQVQCGHSTGSMAAGIAHEFTAFTRQRNRVISAKNARSVQRHKFAKAMPGISVCLHAQCAQLRQQRLRMRANRRLRPCGLGQYCLLFDQIISGKNRAWKDDLMQRRLSVHF